MHIFPIVMRLWIMITSCVTKHTVESHMCPGPTWRTEVPAQKNRKLIVNHKNNCYSTHTRTHTQITRHVLYALVVRHCLSLSSLSMVTSRFPRNISRYISLAEHHIWAGCADLFFQKMYLFTLQYEYIIRPIPGRQADALWFPLHGHTTTMPFTAMKSDNCTVC